MYVRTGPGFLYGDVIVIAVLIFLLSILPAFVSRRVRTSLVVDVGRIIHYFTAITVRSTVSVIPFLLAEWPNSSGSEADIP